MPHKDASSMAATTIQFAKQAGKLSLLPQYAASQDLEPTAAVQAQFITPQDPVIVTTNGGRLPAVPLAEAVELNRLKAEAQSPGSTQGEKAPFPVPDGEEVTSQDGRISMQSERAEAPLRTAIPPFRTHPLFPELPLYGPSSFARDIQCLFFRASSAVLSLAFLGVIVLGSVFTSIPLMFKYVGLRLTFRDPNARRPFYEEEKRRQKVRQEQNKAWIQQKKRRKSDTDGRYSNEENGQAIQYEPMEGGKDPLVCDVGYYARRVGLDIEEFKVQTEDGFIIALWHVYDPHEYTPAPAEHRDHKTPHVFTKRESGNASSSTSSSSSQSDPCELYAKRFRSGMPGYPVLMMHGLLQSSGAYCTNDDDSMAFFLCKRYVARNVFTPPTNCLQRLRRLAR